MERKKGLFEYDKRTDLGIEGSTPDHWVPVDFVAVRAIQAIEAVSRVVNRKSLRSSGTISTTDSKNGTVYKSASTD